MNPDQIEELARIDKINVEKEKDFALRLTPQIADQAGKAAHGGWYTNPNITAAAALSPIPINAQQIHKSVQEQMANAHVLLEDPSRHIDGVIPKPDVAPIPTLSDLLRMDPQVYNTPLHSASPTWWDIVDPGSTWRDVQVNPTAVKSANDFIGLDEMHCFRST